VALPVERLFDAFHAEATRPRRLPEGVTIRTATAPKSIRMSWPDDTSVEVYFTGKGPNRSALQVQHRKLPHQEAVQEMKAFWGEVLAGLSAEVAEGG